MRQFGSGKLHRLATAAFWQFGAISFQKMLKHKGPPSPAAGVLKREEG
jgi:hypothetical protein